MSSMLSVSRPSFCATSLYGDGGVGTAAGSATLGTGSAIGASTCAGFPWLVKSSGSMIYPMFFPKYGWLNAYFLILALLGLRGPRLGCLCRCLCDLLPGFVGLLRHPFLGAVGLACDALLDQ